MTAWAAVEVVSLNPTVMVLPLAPARTFMVGGRQPVLGQARLQARLVQFSFFQTLAYDRLATLGDLLKNMLVWMPVVYGSGEHTSNFNP